MKTICRVKCPGHQLYDQWVLVITQATKNARVKPLNGLDSSTVLFPVTDLADHGGVDPSQIVNHANGTSELIPDPSGQILIKDANGGQQLISGTPGTIHKASPSPIGS